MIARFLSFRHAAVAHTHLTLGLFAQVENNVSGIIDSFFSWMHIYIWDLTASMAVKLSVISIIMIFVRVFELIREVYGNIKETLI